MNSRTCPSRHIKNYSEKGAGIGKFKADRLMPDTVINNHMISVI